MYWKPADGKSGMNLTAEVRDGILNHTGEGVPFTPEGKSSGSATESHILTTTLTMRCEVVSFANQICPKIVLRFWERIIGAGLIIWSATWL